ncbi:hypothetical protein DINM_005431 [Dirofilaria immitis]|nr:hypothetical protein [Dirofilaria immitis]
MGQRDGLLLDSDDSDIPDLDLPTASIRKGRSRLFSRARQNVGSVIVKQQSYSVQIVLMLLLSARPSFNVIIIADDPKHEVVTRELEIIKYELNRIKIDIDMLRLTTSSPGTPVWNASSLLYTRLEDIESQISSIADKIQEKFNNHLENDTINWISERINAVADACSQGCETVSKLIVFNNGSKTLDSTSDKLKRSVLRYLSGLSLVIFLSYSRERNMTNVFASLPLSRLSFISSVRLIEYSTWHNTPANQLLVSGVYYHTAIINIVIAIESSEMTEEEHSDSRTEDDYEEGEEAYDDEGGTLDEEEMLHPEDNYQDELKLLEDDANLSIEELRQKYCNTVAEEEYDDAQSTSTSNDTRKSEGIDDAVANSISQPDMIALPIVSSKKEKGAWLFFGC